MKRNFMFAGVVFMFAVITALKANLIEVASPFLANIEALAQLENGHDDCHSHNYGSESRTVTCNLELGGGWFTSSVKTDCFTTADSSKKCTPTECGQ